MRLHEIKAEVLVMSAGSFSSVSRRESGQKSLPSKSLFLAGCGCFPLVLALFLEGLAGFDGGEVRRQQPMRNCHI